MKLFNRLVILFILVIGTTGCESKSEKASRIILSTLEDRYNEEFVIDSIGNSWGTSDNSTIKAFAYPVNHKERMFRVTITKDLSKVEDKYMLVLMEDKLNEFTEKAYQTDFEKKIHTYIGSDFGSEDYEDMTLEEYFEKNSNTGVVIQIFLNIEDEENIDKLKEAKTISEFISTYSSKNYPINNLLIYYMKSEEFDKIMLDDSKVSDNFATYMNDEYSYNSLRVKFKDLEGSLDAQTIYDLFRK